MDLYCRRCGEPWEMDYVNYEMTSLERVHFKDGEGCPSCFEKEVAKKPFRAELAGVMADLLGDDEDGLAAEMEAAEALMGKSFWE